MSKTGCCCSVLQCPAIITSLAASDVAAKHPFHYLLVLQTSILLLLVVLRSHLTCLVSLRVAAFLLSSCCISLHKILLHHFQLMLLVPLVCPVDAAAALAGFAVRCTASCSCVGSLLLSRLLLLLTTPICLTGAASYCCCLQCHPEAVPAHCAAAGAAATGSTSMSVWHDELLLLLLARCALLAPPAAVLAYPAAARRTCTSGMTWRFLALLM
jgi:hypothetical protein